MSWQEVILIVGSLFFVVALLPSVLGKDKPAFASSVPTAITLFLFGIVYASLDLWFAAFTVSLAGTTWTILAVQKYRMNSLIKSRPAEANTDLSKK